MLFRSILACLVEADLLKGQGYTMMETQHERKFDVVLTCDPHKYQFERYNLKDDEYIYWTMQEVDKDGQVVDTSDFIWCVATEEII